MGVVSRGARLFATNDDHEFVQNSVSAGQTGWTGHRTTHSLMLRCLFRGPATDTLAALRKLRAIAMAMRRKYGTYPPIRGPTAYQFPLVPGRSLRAFVSGDRFSPISKLSWNGLRKIRLLRFHQ